MKTVSSLFVPYNGGKKKGGFVPLFLAVITPVWSLRGDYFLMVPARIEWAEIEQNGLLVVIE